MNLRDYQIECCDAIMAKFQAHQSTMAVLATALGKTVIFAEIIKRFQPKRALVIAHQDQLIFQAADKIHSWTGLTCDIEMAHLFASANTFSRTPVVIATIQTLNSGPKDEKRMKRFNPADFGLIVIDEFHHACAKSYRRALDYFKAGNPDIKILGVTATPKRGDGLALGQVCESLAYEYPIIKGIENGWLVDVAQYFCPVGSLDYSHVKTVAGELNQGDLAKVMEAEENIQGVCHPTLEVMYGLPPHTLDEIPVPEWGNYLASLNRVPRRSILFTVTVAQSEASCNIFNRIVPGIAEWICGKTAKKDRHSIFERFKSGKIHLLCNVGVTVEGFDLPAVEVIAMGRPTLSVSTYVQMVGRGTRTLPGVIDGKLTVDERIEAIKSSPKPIVRIVDFKGNSKRHKLISSFHALGGNMSEAAINRAIEKCVKEGKPKRVLVSINMAEEDLKREAAEKRRQNEEARKARLVAKAKFGFVDVNPFSGHGQNLPTVATARDGRKFSEKQTAVLRKNGIDPSSINYRQGNAIIGKIYSKPTPGQAKVLFKAGYAAAEVEKMDVKSASKEITKLKNNNWKRIAA